MIYIKALGKIAKCGLTAPTMAVPHTKGFSPVGHMDPLRLSHTIADSVILYLLRCTGERPSHEVETWAPAYFTPDPKGRTTPPVATTEQTMFRTKVSF